MKLARRHRGLPPRPFPPRPSFRRASHVSKARRHSGTDREFGRPLAVRAAQTLRRPGQPEPEKVRPGPPAPPEASARSVGGGAGVGGGGRTSGPPQPQARLPVRRRYRCLPEPSRRVASDACEVETQDTEKIRPRGKPRGPPKGKEVEIQGMNVRATRKPL